MVTALKCNKLTLPAYVIFSNYSNVLDVSSFNLDYNI